MTHLNKDKVHGNAMHHPFFPHKTYTALYITVPRCVHQVLFVNRLFNQSVE